MGKTNVVKAAIQKAMKDAKTLPENYRASAIGPLLTYYLSATSPTAERSSSKGSSSKQKPSKKPVNGKPTRPDKIRDMIRGGFFKSGRTIAEIQNELRARGLQTKTTAMPALLLPFVLSNSLKRKVVKVGTKEQFKYFA
jgi:hypothetical protein